MDGWAGVSIRCSRPIRAVLSLDWVGRFEYLISGAFVYCAFDHNCRSLSERSVTQSMVVVMMTTHAGPHLDGQQWQLGSITLLDDCPAHCGGTTFWPGSHKILYYDHAHEYNFTPLDSYHTHYQEITKTIRPVVSHPDSLLIHMHAPRRPSLPLTTQTEMTNLLLC